MLFTYCVVFPHGSRFHNLASGQTFTLFRNPRSGYWNGEHGEYELKLEFYEDNISICSGYASVLSSLTCPVTNSRCNSPRYFLKDIFFEEEYRSLSMGSLLVYIISVEVSLNGGEYLYVSAPLIFSLGFYLRLGFIPDPDEARHKESLYNLSGHGSGIPDTKGYLSKKIEGAKCFNNWKCHTQSLNIKLSEALSNKFKFLQ